MTMPALEKETSVAFDGELYHRRTLSLVEPAISSFKKILKSHVLFNIFFILLILGELLYFLLHLTLLMQSFVIAVHLALIFATLFCYFVLQMYVQARKSEQLTELASTFVATSKQIFPEAGEMPEHYLIVAEACCKLAANLHGQEAQIYTCPAWCSFLSTPMEKLNTLWFWPDVHLMQELLLHACIDQHIQWVHAAPTDLEAHAGLANAYVMLSGLYVDPKTVEGWDDDRWMPRSKYNKLFETKFRATAERAIEEFKILSDYAPQDPWVHAQLAYSYRDLHMPQEEIREYETILHLCPDDKETLFKLGRLYFAQGQNAKGLQIYEMLRQSHSKLAEALIRFYGTYPQTS